MRKALVCGNWKLNHNLAQTRETIGQIIACIGDKTTVDCVIAPVTPLLFAAGEISKNTPLSIAAQNVFFEKKGAFTGEWSTDHLVELGCRYAIVGHSERRTIFGEDDKMVAAKVRACVDNKLRAIACFGENLQQREDGQFPAIISAQVKSIIESLNVDDLAHLILAYEPIWAIGTGKTASSEQAQEIHALTRSLVAKQFGSAPAESLRIIYGGSVTSGNAAALMAQTDIDGLLVGGASLKADSFCAIVQAAAQ